MIPSLLRGINERDMTAVVQSYDLKPFYYPTLFPLKETYSLTWKSLQAMAGLRIAADIVARGVRIDPKTREAINRIQGEIPKIAVKKVMDENRLNDYDIFMAMSSQNPDLRALVEFWAEDTKFCFEAVAARLEWMALRSISTGKLKVTSSNNAGPISVAGADYGIDSTQKFGANTAWGTTASAKPISKDLKAGVDKGKNKGFRPNFAFMSMDTFTAFASTDEVQKLCASYVVNALNLQQMPTPEQANTALKNIPYLHGLQLRVIDQDITTELSDGTRTTGNPFADNVVMFSESEVLGNTFWKRPADLGVQGGPAIRTLNGHTLIKKFAEEEPIQEITMGIANAFPAWTNAQRCLLMRTDATSWSDPS